MEGLAGAELQVGPRAVAETGWRVGAARTARQRPGSGAAQAQVLTRRGMSWPSAWALARITSGSKPAARAARAASR